MKNKKSLNLLMVLFLFIGLMPNVVDTLAQEIKNKPIINYEVKSLDENKNNISFILGENTSYNEENTSNDYNIKEIKDLDTNTILTSLSYEVDKREEYHFLIRYINGLDNDVEETTTINVKGLIEKKEEVVEDTTNVFVEEEKIEEPKEEVVVEEIQPIVEEVTPEEPEVTDPWAGMRTDFDLSEWTTYSNTTTEIVLKKYIGTNSDVWVPGEFEGKQIYISDEAFWPGSGATANIIRRVRFVTENGKKVVIQNRGRESNVVNADLVLFHNQSSLEAVDFTGFSLGEQQKISYLVANTPKLSYIDGLDTLDTSKVRDMTIVFRDCGNTEKPIDTIDLSNWNFSNVTTMEKMFNNSRINNIIISGKEFPELTNMSGFVWDSSATNVTLTNNNFAKLTNMYAFAAQKTANTYFLENLDFSGSTFGALTNFSSDVFSNYNGSSLPQSHGDTTKIKNLSFANCQFPVLTAFNSAFAYMPELISVDLSGIQAPKDVDNRWMFYGSPKVESADFSNSTHGHAGEALNMSTMFENSGIIFNQINFENYELPNATNFSIMFKNCSRIGDIDLNNIINILQNATNLEYMFQYSGAKNINAEGLTFPNVTTVRDMFAHLSTVNSSEDKINVNFKDTNFPVLTNFQAFYYHNNTYVGEFSFENSQMPLVTNMYTFIGKGEAGEFGQKVDLMNFKNATIGIVDPSWFFNTPAGTNDGQRNNRNYRPRYVKTMDFSGASFPKATTFFALFYRNSVENIIFDNVSAPLVTTIQSIFHTATPDVNDIYAEEGLEANISMKNVNFEKVTNMTTLLNSDNRANNVPMNVDFTGSQFPLMTNLHNVFSQYNVGGSTNWADVGKVKTLNLTGVNLEKVTNLGRAFAANPYTESIILKDMNVPLNNNWNWTFHYSTSLRSVDLRGVKAPVVDVKPSNLWIHPGVDGMFAACDIRFDELLFDDEFFKSVKYFKWMFIGNTNTSDLQNSRYIYNQNLGDVDLSRIINEDIVIDIGYMFDGSGVTNILGMENKVYPMLNDMFRFVAGTTKLESFSIKGSQFDNLQTMQALLWESSSHLSKLDFSGAEFTALTNMQDFIGRGWKGKVNGPTEFGVTIDLIDFTDANFPAMTNIGYAFTPNRTDITNQRYAMPKLVKKWDFTNAKFNAVTNVRYMFAYMPVNEILFDGTQFNSLTTFQDLFRCVQNLHQATIRNMDVSKITTTQGFAGYVNIDNYNIDKVMANIDISDLEFTNVTNVIDMFDHSYINLIDMSGVSFDKVNGGINNSIYNMFSRRGKDIDGRAYRINEINMANSNFPILNSLDSAFEELNVGKVNMSGMQIPKVTATTQMFYKSGYNQRGNGIGIEEVDLSNIEFSSTTTMSEMFRYANNLEVVNLDNVNTSTVINMSYMFDQTKIKEIDVTDLDTENVTTMQQMFSAMAYLENVIGIENWDVRKVTTFKDFNKQDWDRNNAVYNNRMRFWNLANWDISETADLTNMFLTADPYSTGTVQFITADLLIVATDPRLLAFNGANGDGTGTGNANQLFKRTFGGPLFNANGGKFEPNSLAGTIYKQHKVGKYVITPDEAIITKEELDKYASTLTGAEFVGWVEKEQTNISRSYLDEETRISSKELSNEIVQSVNLIEDRNKEYLATYSLEKFKINFDGNGADHGNVESQEIEKFTPTQLNANNYNKTGYSFVGWALEPTGTPVYQDQQEINLPDPFITSTSEEVTLYAIFTPNTLNVTFDGNGGTTISGLSSYTQEFKCADHFNLDKNEFVREGYYFDGWGERSIGSSSDADNIHEYVDGENVQFFMDKTLYAQWVPVYTIKFNPNGGTGFMEPLSQRFGSIAILPSCTYQNSNKSFVGWSLTPNGDVIFVDEDAIPFPNDNIMENTITLYAIWNITLTYEYNNDVPPVFIKPNEDYVLNRNEVVKEGYVFKGWNTNELLANAGIVQYEDQATININKNTVLYPVWNPTITINFDANTGNGSMENQVIESGIKASLSTNNFSKEGYSFKGWSTSNNGNVVYKNNQEIKMNTSMPKTITLYAIWEQGNIKVTYDANGGRSDNFEVMYDQEIGQNSSVELIPNRFKKEGYVFTGWSTSQSGSVEYQDGASVIFNESTTLYAIWEESYTLIFDANGGVGNMENQLIAKNSRVTINENTFTKQGCNFVGWSIDKNDSVEFENQAMIDVPGENITNINTTLYAVWENKELEITFDGNGGLFNQNSTYIQTVEANTVQTLDGNKFVREGYEFLGWSTSSNRSVVYNEQSEINIFENVRLYAIWEKQYVITFNSNTDVVETKQQIINANKVTRLDKNTFTREGYNFVGWSFGQTGLVAYNDNDEIVLPNENIIADQTLYAIWEAKELEVTFNGDGAQTIGGLTTYTQKFRADEAFDLVANQFVREGYEFVGWSKQSQGEKVYEDQANISAVENIVLYPLWNQVFTINFDGNNGLGSMLPQNISKGKQTTINANQFVREGYEFVGWSIEVNGEVKYENNALITLPDENITTNTTLYAVWTPKKVTITFNGNENTNGNMTSQVIDANTEVNLEQNAFSRDGYVFKGWSTEINGEVIYQDQGVINILEDITLYAVWNQVFTITFDGNENTGGNMTSQVIEKGIKTPLSTNKFVKENAEFKGWSIDENDSVEYQDGQELLLPNSLIQQDTTLYAVWEETDGSITYHANGGNSENGITITKGYNLGKLATLATDLFTKENAIFKGWNTNQDDANNGIVLFQDGQTIMLESNLELYAVWGQTYTVSYNNNGGIGSIESQVVENGNSITLNNNIFTKEGYIFNNWEDINTKQVYQNQEEIIVNKNIELQAIWTPITYYVVFNGNGATSGSMDELAFNYDQTANLTANNFVKEGYLFDKWTTNKDGSGNSYNNEASVSNLSINNNDTIILYAQWTSATITIAFDGNGAENIVMFPQIITKNSSTTLKQNEFEKEGYQFKGWSTTFDGDVLYQDQASITLPDENITTNTTLYAIWGNVEVMEKTEVNNIIFKNEQNDVSNFVLENITTNNQISNKIESIRQIQTVINKDKIHTVELNEDKNPILVIFGSILSFVMMLLFLI